MKTATLEQLRQKFQDFNNRPCSIKYKNKKEAVFYKTVSEVRNWDNVVKITVRFKEKRQHYLGYGEYGDRSGAAYLLIHSLSKNND